MKSSTYMRHRKKGVILLAIFFQIGISMLYAQSPYRWLGLGDKSFEITNTKSDKFIDSITRSKNQIIDSLLGFKKAEFEFRLWKETMFSNARDCFILSYSNSKFSAHLFQPMRDGGYKEKQISQIGLDTLFWHLDNADIKNMKDDKELRPQAVTYRIDTVGKSLFQIVKRGTDFVDGVLWCFRVKNNTTVRHFAYSNPGEYFKKCPWISEYVEVSLIIRLVEAQITKPITTTK